VSEALPGREVLHGVDFGNNNLLFAGNSSSKRALFRTRTGDPLLTMEVLYQLS
jgi:hypothetical protein